MLDEIERAPKPVHLVREVNADGKAVPACVGGRRVYNIDREWWTDREEAVTCHKCRERMRRGE